MDVRMEHAITPQGDQSLNYDQTIDRHLVHKSSIHEVFITDTRNVGADSFLMGAQLPRQHTLYSDRARNSYDPLLILEVCRQATIVMAHQYFNVPMGWLLLADKVDIKVSARELLIVGRQPANISVLVQVLQKMVKKEALVEAVLMYTISLGDKIVAHVQTEMKGVPKNVYTFMREINRNNKNLSDPFDNFDIEELAPSSLGRYDHRNVVINDSFDSERRIYPAKINPDHPGLFDHEVDHVSAVVLAEICRQASFRHFTQSAPTRKRKRFADWEISRFKMDFIDFAEFEAQIYCQVAEVNTSEQGMEVDIALEVVQGSVTLGRADILWSCE